MRAEVSLKSVFHFGRIVAKRCVFYCFLNAQAELMIWKQYRFRFDTIKVESGLNA